MKLEKAEERIALAAEIIKRMKAELDLSSCKVSMKRKAKALKKTAAAKK